METNQRESFVKTGHVYDRIFKKAENSPPKRCSTLNKLLKAKEAQMTDKEYNEMIKRLKTHDVQVHGAMPKTNSPKIYSKSLALMNEPKPEQRLKSFRKAKPFLEDILEKNNHMRQFLTGSLDQFKFDQFHLDGWAELIGFKSRNLKDTEADKTADKLCLSSIITEIIKFSIGVEPYDKNMGALRTPFQQSILTKSIGHFLCYEIRHIDEIKYLEKRQTQWEADNPKPKPNKKNPSVPEYHQWPNTNWCFCKAHLNRRYTQNELLMDIFQLHTNKFNFKYLQSLADLGLERLEKDEKKFSKVIFDDKKDLLHLLQWALKEYSNDVEMSKVVSYNIKASKKTHYDLAVTTLKERYIKVYALEKKLVMYGRFEKDPNNSDSSDDPNEKENLQKEKQNLHKVVDIYLQGFDGLEKKNEDHFFMKDLKFILVNMKPNINFEKIAESKPQLTQEEMAEAWQQLALSITNKILNDNTNQYLLMTLIFAEMAAKQLTSLTSSLRREQLFARLVQHITGDRFPHISTIEEETKLYNLAYNKKEIIKVLEHLPCSSSRTKLLCSLKKLYPGKLCPPPPQEEFDVNDEFTLHVSLYY